jgi:hypothetical protein
MRGTTDKWLWLRDAAFALLIWVGAAVLAIAVSHADVTAAALPAALALGVCAVGSRWPLSGRIAAAFALVAAAVEPATVLPWTLAAVCLSAVVNGRSGADPQPPLGELDRYLERCRRRGEPATALVVDMEADATALRNLLRSVRVTDSLVVRRSKSRFIVYGLLDGDELTRAPVTARFGEALDGVAPAFGWACYPADGLTLDALLEQAQRTILPAAPASERVAGEAPRAQPQLAPAIELEAERACS